MPSVPRRTLLRLAAPSGTIALAGCLDNILPEDSTPTVGPGTQRRVVLHDQDTVSDRHQVRIEAIVAVPTVTESHTATVRTTLTNEGPERAIGVSTGACSLFNRRDAVSEPQGLWLDYDLENGEPTGNAWVQDGLPEGQSGFGGYGCPKETYGKGDSLQNEYTLWGDGRADGYMRPGTYRWETEVQLWSDADTDGAPTSELVWGFSLTVTEQ